MPKHVEIAKVTGGYEVCLVEKKLPWHLGEA
jgi:hypothetical protein